MLIFGFVYLLLGISFYLFSPFSFSLVISFLVLSFVFFLLGGYINLLGYSFVSYFMTVDFVSVSLVLLSIWVSMLMFLVSLKYYYNNTLPYLFVLSVYLLMIIVILFFVVDSFLFFYLMFEFSLFPTLFLILKWGYQPERMQASFYFVMYTICASLPLLLVILYISSSSFSLFMYIDFPFASFERFVPSYLFYFALVFAFLVKVPMWGVHLWLPKAHVEAPVSGSMILAGILLKLGGYGLLKVYFLSSIVLVDLVNLLLSVNMWGAVIVGLVCMVSSDMKVLIAYSSVIHMGLMVVGILSGYTWGLLGAIFMMVAHGFSSPGMFSLANFNYEVSGSRNIALQKGLFMAHPLSSLFWFVLLAANMSAPPSLNLVSEVFICMSVVELGFWLFFIVFFVTFFSAVYNLYLYSSQQGEFCLFVVPGESMQSSFMLSSFMHFVPVYLLVFSLFYFYF